MKPLPTEHQEQAAVIQWFQLAYPEIKTRLFAVPNGANKSRASAARFAVEGLRAGVPDLMLPIARHGFHGLFIEMKRLKGGRLSREQSDWLDFLGEQGYMAVVCCGSVAAIETLKEYLKNKTFCN